MSCDSEAIIYYGFPMPDFDDPEYSYHDRNEEWRKRKAPAQPENRDDLHSPEWNEWRERLLEWNRSPENVEIQWSGSEECQAYYVHADGLQVMIEWDEQKAIAEIDLGPHPEADKNLREFCEMFGIEFKQPGWYLAARYF